MSLLETRIRFSRKIALLQTFASACGHDWILDQCLRTEREAVWNATHCRVKVRGERCGQPIGHVEHSALFTGTHTFLPIGVLKSTHRYGLAIDLYIMADGEISNDRARYEELGTFWKTLDPLARWGGDFESADLGHFSFEHQGVK